MGVKREEVIGFNELDVVVLEKLKDESVEMGGEKLDEFVDDVDDVKDPKEVIGATGVTVVVIGIVEFDVIYVDVKVTVGVFAVIEDAGIVTG